MSKTKLFRFKHDIIAQLTKEQLVEMYKTLTPETDSEFLTLLYLASERFEVYARQEFSTFFAGVEVGMQDYEVKVGIAFERAIWSLDEEKTNNLLDFVDTEMFGWIKWAHKIHNANKIPIILLRYIVGKSIIYRDDV